MLDDGIARQYLHMSVSRDQKVTIGQAEAAEIDPSALVANLTDLGGEGIVPVHSKEKTSHRVAHIASKGLQNPGSLTNKEIKTLAGSALTQAPDRKPSQRKGR